jgi:hypothetical protein
VFFKNFQFLFFKKKIKNTITFCMKGYIFLFENFRFEESYFITIETDELIPIATPVINTRYATYTTTFKFKIKKIIYAAERLRSFSLKEIEGEVYTTGRIVFSHYLFKVGEEIIPEPKKQIHIFSTFQHLYTFYRNEMFSSIPNGWFKEFDVSGKLLRSKFKQNHIMTKENYFGYANQCLSCNYRKNKTTLKDDDGVVYSYDFIAVLAINSQYHQLFPNSIVSKQFHSCRYNQLYLTYVKNYFNQCLMSKIYIKPTHKSKNHGIDYISPRVNIYKYGRLLPTKNLQIFRKSPWNPMGDINKISVF